MDVRYCPRCGTDEVTTNSWSDHYKRKTTRKCEMCEWHYSTGTYVNTGGTHPRQFERWCSDCECTFQTSERASSHICTVEGLIVERGVGVAVEEVFDELEPYRSSLEVKSLLEDGIRHRELQVVVRDDSYVALRSDRNSVTQLHEAALNAIAEQAPVSRDEIKSHLSIEETYATKYLHQCLTELDDRGIIRMNLGEGYEIQEETWG